MHRSRLCTIVIDCQNADLDQASAFWGRALGRMPKPASRNPAYRHYRTLGSGREDLLRSC